MVIDNKSKKKSKNGTGMFKCIYKGGDQVKTCYPVEWKKKMSLFLIYNIEWWMNSSNINSMIIFK